MVCPCQAFAFGEETVQQGQEETVQTPPANEENSNTEQTEGTGENQQEEENNGEGNTEEEIVQPDILDGITVPADKCAVIISFDKYPTFKLYKSRTWSAKTACSPAKVDTDNAKAVFVLGKGIYTYKTSGTGFFSTKGFMVVTAEDVDAHKKDVEILCEKSGNVDAKGTVYVWNQEVLNTIYGTDNLTGYVTPETPAFAESKKAHEVSSIADRKAYVNKLAAGSQLIDAYCLDETENMPVMFFTDSDLSGAETAFDAAKIVGENGKPTVLVQGQVHGNEPAAGEGTLYLGQRLAGAYGEELCEKVNVCIVPTINTYGAEKYERYNADGADMNRKCLLPNDSDTACVHRLFNEMRPEVVVDTHEKNKCFEVNSSGVIPDITDIEIAGCSSLNSGKNVKKWSLDLADNSIDYCNESGLRAKYYSSHVETTRARGYYAACNSCSLVIETQGIELGKTGYARRTYAQYCAVKSILDEVYANDETIGNDVANDRDKAVEKGKTYDAGRIFVLKHGKGSTGKTHKTYKGSIYGSVGSAVKSAYEGHIKASRTRAYPTAYVIPKTATNASFAAKMLRRNGIEVNEIEPGAVVTLKGYSGTKKAAKLKKASKVTFKSGAYLITMDQTCAPLIASMMEPDVNDNTTSTSAWCLSSKLKISSIYRLESDNPSERMGEYITKSAHTIKAAFSSSKKIKLSRGSFAMNASSEYVDVSYASSDDEIATVDETGLVTFNKKGTVKITVTAPAIYNFKETSKTFTIRIY